MGLARREKRLGVDFFRRDASVVAPDLLGCVLVRRLPTDGREVRVRIVETEAYVGEHDLACHASKGRTERTETLFEAGGVAYVYFIYGVHEMLNVVTGKEGEGQGVLLRAAEAVSGWEEGKAPDMSGPGKLTRALGITRALKGVEVTGDGLHFLPRVGTVRVERTARIGVDYAGEWAGELLRFIDAGSGAVSGRRGKRIQNSEFGIQKGGKGRKK